MINAVPLRKTTYETYNLIALFIFIAETYKNE